MVERVGLDDFNEIPSDEPTGGVPPVHIVTFDEFVGTEEDTAEALLGSADETILPLGGMLLMYGDGGAGKTTLTIDAVCHMAAGEPWLGIGVDRPVRSLMVENEGPRGKFRRKLAEKFATWNGHPPFNTNIVVMEEPWTMFTLAEESHRMALAAAVSQYDIDMVVMGPLVTLGMIGGGTPDEVSAFETLIRTTRAMVTRPFAFWTVHHENKAGDVAGAWERVPDCLMHVQAQGNGHTRIVFRKARWADESHGQKVDLIWSDGRSYDVKPEVDRDLHADIVEAFAADDAWRTSREVAKLIKANHEATRQALSDLVDRGEMTFEIGPHGRGKTAQCFRLQGVPKLLEHPGTPAPSPDVAGVGVPGVPPVSRDGRDTVQNTYDARGGPTDLEHSGPVDQDDTTKPSF